MQPVSTKLVQPLAYSWQKILQITTDHKREIILAHIIAIIGASMSVPVPLLIPLLVDEVLLDQPATIVNTINTIFPTSWQGAVLTFTIVALVTLFLRFMSMILGVWQMRQFTIISKDVVYRIRKGIITHLQNVSMAEYETLGGGQVTSYLVTDLDTIDRFIGVSLSRLLVSILSVVGAAAVLLWIHWQLALFILLLNPAVIYMTTVLGRKVKELKKAENKAYALFQETLVETLEGIQQIRAYNREKHYLGRVIDSANVIKKHSIAYTWKTDAATRLSFSAFLFGFDTFRVIIMMVVLYSDLSLGQMFAMFGYLWFMFTPIQEILNIQYAFHSAEAALQRVNTLFSLSREPQYIHQYDPFTDHATATLRLDKVCFAYHQQDDWVLDHISLNIQAGEKVAIVGASGGGKTTLVHILLGLYPPSAGMLYFNNVPLTQIGLDVVREHVVTVLQHPALFNDTLRMNLTLGRDIADEQLWEALTIAQLSEFVKGMEQGLETILGQRGIRLSGGQRQRVACARMILMDPKVVILDEATSALDTATESRLHTAFNRFLQGKTTIIIAHRLSAVKQADRVLVLDRGHIIEEGHPDHLVLADGLYAKLYGKQTH